MAKKNILGSFAKFAITNKESNNLKGGRNSNLINTGSYGFIIWDDVEVRDPGLVINLSENGSQIVRKKRL